MPDSIVPILPHLPAFVMVLFRITGIFFFAPIFGSNVIPVRLKVLLALVLAICVYPIIPPQVPMELSLMTLWAAVGSELLIGLIIGYGASIPLIALQMGGLLMGQQLGLGLARVYNPDFNEETEILGQFLFLMALTVFLILDGHHAILAALVGSFQKVPLGGYIPDGDLLMLVTGLLKAMFELAIRVSAPLLTLVFLETVAMGFLARTVPQINLLSLGFPIRIIVGFLIVVAIIATMNDALIAMIRQTMNNLLRIFTVTPAL
jgi:flagellar biosynthetic protein FliR